MLVQVGLLREERDILWVNLIQWLQKITPQNQSANFRGLIVRNTTTALSLSGDARENFLKADVNFEFVGPLCDSVGIGRRDLLEMSDFSDRAKLTGLTNGLVLELTNFIAREKLEPTVLVPWIRNFEPLFCRDGKIRNAYRPLRASVRNLRIQYRNNQSSRKRSRGCLDEFLQSPFDLEVDSDETEYRSIAMVKAHLRKKRRTAINKPEIKEEDEPFDISQTNELDSNQTMHSENEKQGSKTNSATHLDNVGDARTDTGDCVTLLDISVLSLQKLAEMYGGKNEVAKVVSMDLLKNHFSAMLKEDANLRFLNDKVLACDSTEGGASVLVPPLKFLHYISQFLFEVIDIIEQQMMSFERDIVNTAGEKLGRDKHPKFRSFLNFDESAVTRYIHMASEILSPREETNPNYRRHWLAFCAERDNCSRLPINHSNRIINYFEAAAGLVHHHQDVALFVSELQDLNNDADILLESVSADASDENMQALVCVVAIVYLKVLGPLWQLLKSDGEYYLFSRYIYCLYDKLLEWSKDTSHLMQPEALLNVFLQLPVQESNFKGVFRYCRVNAENQYGTLVRACLQKMMKALAAVMEDNLKDFLPGGEYCKEMPREITVQMSNCTFLQLMGEYPFGHAYPYEKNRPDKTPGQAEGSVSQEEKREPAPQKTMDESTSPPPVVTSYPGKTVQKQLKRLNAFKEPNLKDARKMKVNRLKQKAQDHVYKKMIIRAVSKNSGPCKSKQDVERLLEKLEGAGRREKCEAFRCELNYQKCIVGSRDKKLNHFGFSLTDMVSALKDVLPNEKVSVATPAQNVVQAEVQTGIASNETRSPTLSTTALSTDP